MRGAAFAALLIAASGKKVAYETVKQLLSDCSRGDMKVCAQLQAYGGNNGADNAYCATIELPNEDAFKTKWLPYCRVAASCDREADAPPAGAKLTFKVEITNRNFKQMIADLPEHVQEKIGHGPRRDMMDPSVSGAIACRAWSQLSDVHNTKIYDANYFSYSDANGVQSCKLYRSVPFDGDNSVELNFASNGMWGERSCSCLRTEGVKCKKLASSDEIVSVCVQDPSDPICMTVDADGIHSSVDGCLVGQGTTCEKSDDLVTMCYHGVNGQVDVQGSVSVSDSESVRKFLVDAAEGNFDEFASFVGFQRDSDHVSPRARTVIPAIAGPVACRNLAVLQGALGKRYATGENNYFYYDPVEKACHFISHKPETIVTGSSIYGDDFCV